jgi:hypothetical protein
LHDELIRRYASIPVQPGTHELGVVGNNFGSFSRLAEIMDNEKPAKRIFKRKMICMVELFARIPDGRKAELF